MDYESLVDLAMSSKKLCAKLRPRAFRDMVSISTACESGEQPLHRTASHLCRLVYVHSGY